MREFLRRHLAGDLAAHGLVEFGQDVGVELAAYRVQHRGTLIRGDPLQQVRNIGGMKGGELGPDGPGVFGVENIPDEIGRQRQGFLGPAVGARDRMGLSHRIPPGVLGSWCGREDSNFHGVAPTATSTLRVYQFRHDRMSETR